MEKIFFKEVRLNALKTWFAKTKRIRSNHNDIIEDSPECYWQENFTSRIESHNSLFCSIGEWNSHITDLLNLNCYDQLCFDNEVDRSALFRHYTRILLITSEILTDFENLLKLISQSNNKYKTQNELRLILTSNQLPFTVQQLIEFINNICKHKIGDVNRGSFTMKKYHCHNHHIDYHFLDSGSSGNSLTINIQNFKSSAYLSKAPLEIFKLSDIIDQLVFGYKTISQHLEKNYLYVKDELKRFETIIVVEEICKE